MESTHRFLRNTWYVAAWSHGLGEKPVGVRILDEPVVLFRKSDGTAVAIGGRCPHRFAPLHLGKVKGDVIECPYHGLQYGDSGACVLNPHGDGRIPPAARVPSYPLVERHDALWIWMGDPATADPTKIVDITSMRNAGRPFKTAHGYLHVKANYQLVIDNLLDLSHAIYLHPAFQEVESEDPGLTERRMEMKRDGDTVWAYFWSNNSAMNPFFHLIWGEEAPHRGDVRNHMRWDAPAILQLDSGMTTVGGATAQGPSVPSVHLITPETERSAHYFWSVSHDMQIDNPQVTAMLQMTIANAFVNEDEPMLAACQEMMGGTDLMAMKPVVLAGDGAALSARRVVKSMLEKQLTQPS
jgi:phenylpropionate dioxygenase-like ring-hydroxylating dioxygenase large terminal subunit